jgi:stage V sporulation protein G
MEISDIRVKLIQDSSDRLKAVCSITLDDEFVVRDLKVVEGTNGLFVAMPSRKLSVHCPQCRGKNHLRARFCNECGTKLPPARAGGDAAGRLRMHRDIAHPINPTFRETVQNCVIEKYRAESELAKSPDYAPVDIDADYEEKILEVVEEPESSYGPSEYDQLIAGLNKGASLEPPRERETRPAPPVSAPKPPRQNDRPRSESNGRQARPARSAPPRAPQRGDSRRSDGGRPPRNQGSSVRPAPAPPVAAQWETDAVDEVNGNVAPRDQQPAPRTGRRPSVPQPRRTEERPPPRRAEARTALRKTEEATVVRQVDEPATRREKAPVTTRPSQAPSAPQKKPGKVEDLPFGAGL